MKLVRETRWRRDYRQEGMDATRIESRFQDGSASITLSELEAEWPAWSSWERLDFAQQFRTSGSPDGIEILRFMMRHGDTKIWSAIASAVVYRLPQEESAPFVLHAYSVCDPTEAGNILQALAKTGLPEAHKILRNHLAILWANPDLLRQDRKMNHVASAAIFCLSHLLALGEPPGEFRSQYEILLNHPCELERKRTRTFLGNYFSEGG
jgi:hypothetical protein